MLAINHACWVSIEMIQKICITNRRLQLSNNETTSTPPRRKSLQVLLIWYKAETNECWWLPHVNNHHRQSVTSTNFRGALLPAPKVGGRATATLLPLFRRPWHHRSAYIHSTGQSETWCTVHSVHSTVVQFSVDRYRHYTYTLQSTVRAI